MLRLLSVLMLALIVGPAAGARWLASTPSASQSVTDYILAQPDLQTFYAAIEAANAVEEYNSAPGLTIFAPNDVAFEMLAEELNMTVDSLLNSSMILPIVQYSASSQPLQSSDFSNKQNLLTLWVPQSLTIQMVATSEVSTQSIAPAAPQLITVVGVNSQANIISADAQIGNTFVDVVDTVLLPSDYATYEN